MCASANRPNIDDYYSDRDGLHSTVHATCIIKTITVTNPPNALRGESQQMTYPRDDRQDETCEGGGSKGG